MLTKNNKISEENINDLGLKLAEYEDNLENIFNRVDKSIEENGEEINHFKEDWLANINEYNDEIETLKLQANDKFIDISQEFEQRIFTDIKTRYSENEEVLNSNFNELKKNIEENIKTFNGLLNDSKKEINDAISNIKDEFKEDLGEWKDGIDSDIEEKNKEIENYFKKINENAINLELTLSEKTKEIEREYYDRGEKLIIENSKLLDDYIDKFNILGSEVEVLKNRIDTEVKQKVDDGKETISDIFKKGSIDLQNNYMLFQEEAQTKIEYYKKEISKFSRTSNRSMINSLPDF